MQDRNTRKIFILPWEEKNHVVTKYLLRKHKKKEQTKLAGEPSQWQAVNEARGKYVLPCWRNWKGGREGKKNPTLPGSIEEG